MTAYLIVKSDTSNVNKKEFDDWYQTEHLIEAQEAFRSFSTKRGWIKDTKFHVAIYKFKNIPFIVSEHWSGYSTKSNKIK